MWFFKFKIGYKFFNQFSPNKVKDILLNCHKNNKMQKL